MLTYRLSADSAAVNASTAFVDSGLSFPIVGGLQYSVRGVLYYDSNATADIKFATVGVTATLTGKHAYHGLGPAATSPGVSEQAWLSAFGTGNPFALGGDTFTQMTAHVYMDLTGNVDGSVKIQFAQNTSTGIDTKVRQESYLQVRVIR